MDEALGLSGEGAAVSPPAPTPLVWHRADIGVTGTTTVSSWADESGNGRHATGSGGTRPALVATDASYNGHPTIDFAGAKVLANAAWGSTTTGSLTFYFVGNCGATDAYHCAIDGAPLNTATDVEGAILSNPANVGTNLSDTVTEFTFGALSVAQQLTSPCVVVLTINASTFVTSLYLNSLTPVATVTGADPSPKAIKIKGHTLGALSDSAYWGMAAEWEGKLAEVGIYAGVLTSTQIASIVNEAASRYALTVQYLGINPTSVGGISPVFGDDIGGTAVTLNGWGFSVATPTVTFDGVAATSVVVVNDNQLTCVAPAHARGSVDVVVTVAGHSATLSSGFQYLLTPYTLGADAWYRGDRGISLVSGNVSTWADTGPLAVAAHDLVDSGSAAKRPVYTAADAVFNNQPSLNYSTAARQLLSGSVSYATPQTLFVVGAPSATATDGGIYFGGDTKPWIYKNASDANQYAIDTSVGTLGAHSPAFVSIVAFNGASSSHMKNTTTATTFAAGGGHTIAQIWTGVTLAGSNSGKLAECALFRTTLPTLTQRQQLAQDSGVRYGITIS